MRTRSIAVVSVLVLAGCATVSDPDAAGEERTSATATESSTGPPPPAPSPRLSSLDLASAEEFADDTIMAISFGDWSMFYMMTGGEGSMLSHQDFVTANEVCTEPPSIHLESVKRGPDQWTAVALVFFEGTRYPLRLVMDGGWRWKRPFYFANTGRARTAGEAVIRWFEAGACEGALTRDWPENPWACPPSHPVKANVAFDYPHDLIYHLPGWRYYPVTEPEECFATITEAEYAGYRASYVR